MLHMRAIKATPLLLRHRYYAHVFAVLHHRGRLYNQMMHQATHHPNARANARMNHVHNHFMHHTYANKVVHSIHRVHMACHSIG